MAKSFGALISEARKKKGLSQKDLASRLSISAPYLNDIEHDRRNPPAEDMIGKIAHELGLSKARLCLVAGTVPADVRDEASTAPPAALETAWAAFRRDLKRKG